MDTAGNTVEIMPPKPVEPLPSPPEQGQAKPKGKRKSQTKSRARKGKPGKIHIRLPSIEAYEKEICFPAEAPGRVVVRLERLMGSDKIRPVDEKYMSTLIQRLEEEEVFRFDRKIRLRKKAERERHRQLAINGLMEPGPDMQDLYNHPVFRVNRILSRLSKLDNSFTNKPGHKLPPISQIDPFKDDETGKYFCDYPTHVELRKKCEKTKDEQIEVDQLLADLEELDDALGGNYPSKSYAHFAGKGGKSRVLTTAPPPSVVSVAVQREDEDEDETDEELEALGIPGHDEAGEEEELTEMEEVVLGLSREYMESLTSLQNRYGVPLSDGFEEMWKPYRSDLIEKYFEQDSLDELYVSAKEIFEMYTRQDLTSSDHTKVALTPATAEEAIEDEEEEDEYEEHEMESEEEGAGEESGPTDMPATTGEVTMSDLDEMEETEGAPVESNEGEAEEQMEPEAVEIVVTESEPVPDLEPVVEVSESVEEFEEEETEEE